MGGVSFPQSAENAGDSHHAIFGPRSIFFPPWVLKRSLVLGPAVTLGPVKWHVTPARPMVDMRVVAGRMVSDKCSNSNPIPSNKTALLIFSMYDIIADCIR